MERPQDLSTNKGLTIGKSHKDVGHTPVLGIMAMKGAVEKHLSPYMEHMHQN